MSNPNTSEVVTCEFCGEEYISLFICLTKEEAKRKCFIEEEE